MSTATSADTILEGLDEILTVIRLGLPPELRRSLACTNMIESVYSVVRQVCRNVKRRHRRSAKAAGKLLLPTPAAGRASPPSGIDPEIARTDSNSPTEKPGPCARGSQFSPRAARTHQAGDEAPELPSEVEENERHKTTPCDTPEPCRSG